MRTNELFSLAGKTALITGGSRGLGFYMARGLGEMGAKVVIVARNADELETARAQLAADGIDCSVLVANLARFELIPQLVDDALKQLGTIDILVNNAGTIWNAPAEDHPTEGWNKVMDLNVNAMFMLTREVGKRVMIPRQSGKILNVSSLAGLGGFPAEWKATYLSYCTSKSAVVGFTRGLATEWGKHNINVNAICPGIFPTAMADALASDPTIGGMAATPLGRFGFEDDLKGLAAFLVSEASRHVTGQVIAVDGGMSAAF